MAIPMTYEQAIEFLYNLEHGSVKLGLERIEAACRALGHPERRYVTVHIAGTNGKGSTAAFLAAICEAAGYRTGLLTSPHLLEFTERIRIGGRMHGREHVAALTSELAGLIRETHLSYFEATTALAFESFARAAVDVAIIEVGMGGRLDATNVVAPAVTVVTGIELDHVKSLGDTREKIAAEKAGIMKAYVPMLVAPVGPGVGQVFRERGRELAAPVAFLDERAALLATEPIDAGTRYRFERATGGDACERVVGLRGEHQVQNAMLAEEAARLLDAAGFSISTEARAAGLSTATWPGRFDVLRAAGQRPPIVFDVAHNPSGCRAMVDTYRRWMAGGGAPRIVVGMLGDKDHEDFFACLRELGGRVYIVPLKSPRAASSEDLAAAAGAAGCSTVTCGSVSEAWSAVRAGPEPVLVTGSFFTVEAVMRELEMAPPENLFAVPGRGACVCV